MAAGKPRMAKLATIAKTTKTASKTAPKAAAPASRAAPKPPILASAARTTNTVGAGKWTYEPVPHWGRGAGGVPEFGTVSGIYGDSKDNVYVFARTLEPGVFVFNRDGKLLRKWGADVFRHAHGIWIGPDATRRGEEMILLTDRDLHQVIKYTLNGDRVATWGAAYREPGDAGQPFNQPARATLGPNGQMFVADGYGQYRVHHFDPDGELLHSWGKRGKGPGEFGWPVHHALLDPRGRVIVSDRGNDRLQLFTPEGRFLKEWGGVAFPQDYAFTPDGELLLCEGSPPAASADHPRGIAVLDLDGNVLARWGGPGTALGQFTDSPHSIWADSRGDFYVGEVTSPNRLTKFIRK